LNTYALNHPRMHVSYWTLFFSCGIDMNNWIIIMQGELVLMSDWYGCQVMDTSSQSTPNWFPGPRDLRFLADQILVARQNLGATAPATTPRYSTSTRDATEVKQPRFQIQESREREPREKMWEWFCQICLLPLDFAACIILWLEKFNL